MRRSRRSRSGPGSRFRPGRRPPCSARRCCCGSCAGPRPALPPPPPRGRSGGSHGPVRRSPASPSPCRRSASRRSRSGRRPAAASPWRRGAPSPTCCPGAGRAPSRRPGAGAALAGAGVLLQRLSRNAIASPEVLGVSSGAALGLVLALLLVPAPSYGTQLAAASLGGLAAVAALLSLARRLTTAPEQVLVAGLALGAMLGAVLAVLMASGDPRMLLVANWLAGSTYGVTPTLAVAVAASAAGLAAACAAVTRWLDLAPLGPAAMQALGAGPLTAGATILVLAALMTAAATLAVGPLSFVGLIAPHLARRLGFVRARDQLAAAILLGALLMLAADWLGRVAYPPFQVPAGLVGMLAAGPLLLWLLRPPGRRGGRTG
ncbi:MAG: iron chelate uptake ABC transporter family permease subunit [Methylobacterium frigidaeris]